MALTTHITIHYTLHILPVLIAEQSAQEEADPRCHPKRCPIGNRIDTGVSVQELNIRSEQTRNHLQI